VLEKLGKLQCGIIPQPTTTATETTTTTIPMDYPPYSNGKATEDVGYPMSDSYHPITFHYNKRTIITTTATPPASPPPEKKIHPHHPTS